MTSLRLIATIVAVIAAPGLGQADLKPLVPGRQAPALDCVDSANRHLSWAKNKWAGRGVLVLFHSHDMRFSRRAVQEVADSLAKTKQLIGHLGVLVVSNHQDSVAEIQLAMAKTSLPFAVTIDAERQRFAAYGVIAYPTAFVLNAAKVVLHVHKGYGPLFAAKVRASAIHAAGKVDAVGYAKLIGPVDSMNRTRAYTKAGRTLGMAIKMVEAGMILKACTSLQESVTEDCGHARALALLADLLLRLGQTDKAKPWIERLRRLDAENSELLFLDAAVLIRAGKTQAAFEILEDADSKSARTAFLLGQAYEIEKKFQEAAKWYREALRQVLNKQVRL